jgi:ribonuclease I
MAFFPVTELLYIFALQKCNVTSQYSIHGLWPQWPNGSWPQYCNNGSKFEMKNVGTILSEMNEYWYSCPGDSSNFLFWSHEWSKHGTCTYMSQESYFSLGLSIYQSYPWKSQCDGSPECLVRFSNLIVYGYYRIF